MSQVATSTEPVGGPIPSGRYEWRYWDGGWTNRVANSRARRRRGARTEPSPRRHPGPDRAAPRHPIRRSDPRRDHAPRADAAPVDATATAAPPRAA